jgi:hypothetical protein
VRPLLRPRPPPPRALPPDGAARRRGGGAAAAGASVLAGVDLSPLAAFVWPDAALAEPDEVWDDSLAWLDEEVEEAAA